MRYYKIIITNPKTGKVWVPPSFNGVNLGGASYTSVVPILNGARPIGTASVPGALNVELDIFSYNYDQAVGNGAITIWGVSLQEIQQASNLNYFGIEVWGGMAPGLPLATAQAKYAGILARGTIFPAFGNWQGTDQTLNLTVIPGGANSSGAPLFGSAKSPANISFNWRRGTQLAPVLQSVFQTAFPGVTAAINISPNLVAPVDQPFVNVTLQQFASYLSAYTRTLINQSGYGGVRIAYDPAKNALNVTDGTKTPAAKTLQFQDFVGQPTWLGTAVNFKTPMRADIKIGSIVTMPAGLNPLVTQQAAQLGKSRAAFQGNYRITQMRHVGNFREASGDAWVTVFDGVPAPTLASAAVQGFAAGVAQAFTGSSNSLLTGAMPQNQRRAAGAALVAGRIGARPRASRGG